MMSIKERKDLTAEEIAYYKEYDGHWEKMEDWSTFRVDWNKKGEITLVRGQDLSPEARARLMSPAKPNVLDVMSVAFAKKTGRRIPKGARSKFTKQEIKAITSIIK